MRPGIRESEVSCIRRNEMRRGMSTEASMTAMSLKLLGKNLQAVAGWSDLQDAPGAGSARHGVVLALVLALAGLLWCNRVLLGSHTASPSPEQSCVTGQPT